MSAEAAPAPLYHSPWGLLPFQADHVVQAYLRERTLAVWDTGLGKTHLDMATAALLFEDGMVDLHLLVCEQNKVAEWVADFARFTDLVAIDYRGPADRRRKIVLSLDSPEPVKIGRKKTDTVHRPQVLVGTYETFRNDLAESKTTTTKGGRKVKTVSPGMLTLAIASKRLLIGYDEMTKVGNRGSTMHMAQALLLKEVAKAGGSARLIGLTATPISTDPESYYNLGRLLCPDLVGTVKSFEADHVQYRDLYGRGTFKNLTPETRTEPWVIPLSEKMAPVLLRKRKTDDDVREQFPETSERIVPVMMTDRQADFYETVRASLDPDDQGLITVLRQIAGIPESLAHSRGQLAQAIVKEVGVEGLRALGAAKVDVLTERLRPIVDQGDQAVVFSFFGPSMIPLLSRRLRKEGFIVAEHYGAMGTDAQERAREAFRAGQVQMLISSDAGARGINLPQASYAIEFESGITHAIRTQRLNRIHRIDSRSFGHDKVYFQTLITQNTVEEGLFEHTLERNEWSDLLLGDEDAGEHFMTAEMRRRLLAISRPV